MGTAARLHAAFDVSVDLPGKLVDGPVALNRELIEERGSTEIATGQVSGGRMKLHVESEPGLFTLVIAGSELPLVAATGDTLKVVMAAEKVAVVGWEVAMGAEVAAAGEAGSGLVEEMGAEDSEMVDLVVG